MFSGVLYPSVSMDLYLTQINAIDTRWYIIPHLFSPGKTVGPKRVAQSPQK